jgi:NADH:ubiquinone oxidoreductase subunit C
MSKYEEFTNIIVKNISAKPTTATNTTESKKTTSSEKKPKKITASDFAAAMIDNNFKDVYDMITVQCQNNIHNENTI